MKEIADITNIVNLTLAKVKILKIKSDHYGFYHLTEDVQKQLDDSLAAIDGLLSHLTNTPIE